MVTLKDVAERAGVSAATVSYYVNGTKSVSQKTKYRIQRAIEELNYVPNYAARSLKAEGIPEIAVVFPDIDATYRSEILKGIVNCAEQRDYTVSVAFSYNSPIMEQKILKEFIGKNIRGLIINTCQQDNAEFFRKNLLDRNVCSVFIEQCPQNVNVNYYSFDNYHCYYELTKALLDKGYEEIAIIEGPRTYMTVEAAADGYRSAFREAGKRFSEDWIVYTDTSKEDAFRECMKHLVRKPPQAVFTYSETALKGALEAFSVFGLSVPKDICFITMGEDSWNHSDTYPGVLQVARAAYSLGEKSTQLLFRNLEEPGTLDPQFRLFTDFLKPVLDHLPDPPERTAFPAILSDQKTLKILAYPLMTMKALHLMSENFTEQTGIRVEFEACEVRELTDRIVRERKRKTPSFDICQYDVPWITYLANSEALMDITELMERRKDIKERFIEKNMANCYYRGRCYGIPIIGGTQMLFYRRDLFENSAIQREFQKQHQLPLRPPKTWTEFNGIARFFTREYNPESPTEFGTLITGAPTEDLIVELLVRLWSFGGDLTDAGGRLALHTPQNVRGIQSILETCRYAYDGVLNDSADDLFDQFGQGRFAMMLSFSEYASRIMEQIHGDTVSRIGYSMVPGQTPANVGWHLGLHPNTEKAELAEQFFDWLSDRQNSYYLTILAGQTAVKAPRDNHEIRRLYPWMQITEEGQKLAKSRLYPYRGRKSMIRPSEIEAILRDMFLVMREDPGSIGPLLDDAQKRIEKLFV